MDNREKVVLEVLGGVESPCLVLLDGDGSGGGTRIAGPKPWGGSTGVHHRFEVDRAELLALLSPPEAPAPTPGEAGKLEGWDFAFEEIIEGAEVSGYVGEYSMDGGDIAMLWEVFDMIRKRQATLSAPDEVRGEALAWRIEWYGDGGWKEYDTVSKDPTAAYDDRPNFRVLALFTRPPQSHALEFIRECANGAYPDSDKESLLEWMTGRAKAILGEEK